MDISYTNSALLMTIVVVAITALIILGMRSAALVPGRVQSVAEMLYEFVVDMVDTNAGHGARPFVPFIFTLFMFILFANLFGLIPWSFTVTSHIIVTFALAIIVFIGVTIIGIVRHGFGFLRLFVPHGVPAILLVLLVPIEILSYIIRPFTLSIRLFANMLAGHTMLAIFGAFAAAIGVLAIAPIGINIALFGIEFLVAVLQAYVFAVLTCLYLHDALHLH
ncbi:MAG TPA: F0F1 ATP synthase subunit A [Stellaceae bacterium]|nr:F0F1 ATP synthase subunit A [Stellaceae bacterium]